MPWRQSRFGKRLKKFLIFRFNEQHALILKGFIDLVGAIGGIDVVVEKPINDPTYPDFGWGYDAFTLSVGAQTLDGEKALKYARSRHDSSDF